MLSCGAEDGHGRPCPLPGAYVVAPGHQPQSTPKEEIIAVGSCGVHLPLAVDQMSEVDKRFVVVAVAGAMVVPVRNTRYAT